MSKWKTIAPQDDSPTPAPPARPRRRRWAFRLAALVAAPLLTLAAIEAALRLAGYGYPTSFFRPLRIGQEECLVENDKFGLRFFPPEVARSPAPVVMRAHKEPGSCRIFILGESAALGDPRPAYGAGRYLQALLQERFPSNDFEVINVAMTAINSHVLVPLARECARHQGDFWIVYMGNNEMVGPFGATAVFGSRAPSWQFVRMGLALQRTRLGQLLMSLAHKVGGAKRTSWGGMKMFLNSRVPPKDPRKEVVYRNFARNLEDILQAAEGSGARVLLNTVAVNLKDCAPFASWPATNLPPDQQAGFNRARAQAESARGQGGWAEGAQICESALNMEPQFAQLEFLWGDCLLSQTNLAGARLHFQAACDYDSLPFRADSRINAVISDISRQPEHTPFFDAAGWLAINSPEGIPGTNFFYEHVHLNFDGNYLLARAWAEAIESQIQNLKSKFKNPDWASQALCERRLGLSDWNRYSVVLDVIERLKQPPFTGQSNHNLQLESLRAQLRQLRARLTPAAADAARAMYAEALARAPQDHRLHENLAEFLEETGHFSDAVAEWQKVRDLLPHHHLAYYQMGRLLARQGKLAEAQVPLHYALALRPDLAEGWLELGKIHALEGKEALALKEYERDHQLAPEDYRVYYHMGKALSKLKRGSESVTQLRKSVQIKPDFWEGCYALGEELAFAGQHQEAREQFERVLQLKPDYAPAHLNLGVALAQQGQRQEALAQFEEALRLEPQNKAAKSYVEKMRVGQSRVP